MRDLDSDGYLFLTGRINEIINRGGEKIAPQEVDDVLMEHPAVAQAVAFAVPHARLGEDIAEPRCCTRILRLRPVIYASLLQRAWLLFRSRTRCIAG